MKICSGKHIQGQQYLLFNTNVKLWNGCKYTNVSNMKSVVLHATITVNIIVNKFKKSKSTFNSSYDFT